MAKQGDCTGLAMLISLGVDVNARDEREATPAHIAATHGRAACLRTLIQAGADIDARDENGWTPISSAAAAEQEACLAVLIEAGANLGLTIAKGPRVLNTGPAWSPAHFAAHQGNATCIRLLAHAHAPLNLADADGFTPAMIGSVFGSEDGMRALVNSGSDLFILSVGPTGLTTRGLALQRGRSGIVSLILAYKESEELSRSLGHAGDAKSAQLRI